MENKLELIVRDSGLEGTKTKYILDNFQEYFKIASEWEVKAKAIIVTNESQQADMDMARVGRLFLREKRITIEKSRKKLKEQCLREGKAIDGISNVLKGLIIPIEQYLDEQEHFTLYKKRAEALKEKLVLEEKLEKERIEKEEAEKAEQERIRKEHIRLQKEAAEKETALKLEREKVEEEKKIQEDILNAEKDKAEAKRIQKEYEHKLEKERIEKEKEEKELRAKETIRKLKEEKLKLENNAIICPYCKKSFVRSIK